MDQLSALLEKNGLLWPLTDFRLYGGQLAYRVAVPHTEAMETWHALRELVGQTRHWPVICPTNIGLESELSYPSETPAAELVAQAETLDLDAWIAAQNNPADYEEFDIYVRGVWPDWLDPSHLEGYDPEDFIGLDEMFVTPAEPSVEIVLLPVQDS